MKKLLILVTILFVLFGCEENQPSDTLKPPSQVSFNKETSVVNWSFLEGTTYVISINEVLHDVNTNTFDMSQYITGDYEIKVSSVRGSEVSYYSEYLYFSIVKEVELNFCLKDNAMTFTTDVEGLDYVILVSHQNEEVETLKQKENTVNLKQLDGIVSYDFKAYFKGTLVYERILNVHLDGYTHVSGSGDFKLKTNKEPEVYFNHMLLSVSQYDFIDNALVIKASFLSEQAEGVYCVEVRGTSSYFTFVSYTSTPKPKLLSDSVVTYDNADLTFKFELYGGSFLGVSSTPNLTKDEYSYIDGTLLIKQSYIERVKKENKEIKSIILNYAVDNDTGTIIGYLTIRLD